MSLYQDLELSTRRNRYVFLKKINLRVSAHPIYYPQPNTNFVKYACIEDFKLICGRLLFFCVSQSQVVAAMFAIILTRISLYNGTRHRSIANALTHISLGLVFVALFCDVIKMNFGLDPAVPFDKPDTP